MINKNCFKFLYRFLIGSFDKKYPTLTVARFFLFFSSDHRSQLNIPLFGVEVNWFRRNPAVAGSSACSSLQFFVLLHFTKNEMKEFENIALYLNFLRFIPSKKRFTKEEAEVRK